MVIFKSRGILVAAPLVRNCAKRRSGKRVAERGAARRRVCAEEHEASVKAGILAGNTAGDLSG
jgi:hypothetical protein